MKPSFKLIDEEAAKDLERQVKKLQCDVCNNPHGWFGMLEIDPDTCEIKGVYCNEHNPRK